MDFWETPFPWEAVNEAINNNTFDYSPSTEARLLFESQTGRPWDNVAEDSRVMLSCPRCGCKSAAVLTTSDRAEVWTGPDPGELGFGYAERDFHVSCLHCSLEINHDLLKAQKFRDDLESLLNKDCPMPGTLLTLDGAVNLSLSVVDLLNRCRTARRSYRLQA